MRTAQDVKKKLELLASLAEIEIATKLLAAPTRDGPDEHPADLHYRRLKTIMAPMDKDCDEYKMLVDYAILTQGKTHQSMWSLVVEDIFEIAREGEDANFASWADNHNRVLLWHGSRLTNYVGILSQGLRIAPPEAPVTGYMFGKGVYFADMCSKSAQYCFPSRGRNEGIMLLCEVALGTPRELVTSCYNADKLPKGHDSTKGCGKAFPPPDQWKVIKGGVRVPCCDPIEKQIDGGHLQYNEYIVYDTSQIALRYLLRVKFNFGGKR